MKSFATAALVKFSRVFAADPIGTTTAVVAAAPYMLAAGAIVGIGYGIYKAATKC